MSIDPDVIIESSNLPDVVDKVARHVTTSEHVQVFERGDVVVGFVGDKAMKEMERPYRLVVMQDDSFAQRVNRSGFRIGRRDLRSGDVRIINCPPSIARTILSERLHLFPQIDAIAETPTIAANGDRLYRSGYSGKHRMLMHFDERRFEPASFEEPVNADDVDAAVLYLRDLLRGFPFESEIDESVAIALLMTAVLRPGLELAPGFAISAHAPGTGKTYLTAIASELATGRAPGLISWPDDQIEFRKTLLACGIGGDAILPIDNVNGILRSDALCVFLTSQRYRQRMLGTNEQAEVPTRTLVIVNGINLAIAGDLVRRFLFCQMDAGIERPERRAFAFEPLQSVRAERQHYVRACLTITRAYLESDGLAEMPKPLAPLAGFGQWSRLVQEPMVWAGMRDPVASQQTAEAIDPDRLQLRQMLQACTAVIGVRKPFDVSGLVRTSKAEIVGDDEGNQARHDLRNAIEETVLIRGGEISTKSLGKWFGRVEGRVVDGLRFTRCKEDKTRTGIYWMLDRA